jgi:hypothetical protein
MKEEGGGMAHLGHKVARPVANATHIKRKRKSSSTKDAKNSKGSATTTSSSAASNR